MKFPLPIYESIKIGEQGDFDVVVGLDKNLAEQLKKYSLDDTDIDLQKNTRDRKRFGEGSYEDWYKKIRTPFSLIHKGTGAMAGIVWFGPEPAHEGCTCHTSAFRSYAPFRGKGIMKGFAKFAMDFYLEQSPNTNLWAEVKKGNTASLNLLSYLGFTVDEKLSNETSIILGKKVVPYDSEKSVVK
jgi:RimJ/RimL family protein N-acetyltransferase